MWAVIIWIAIAVFTAVVAASKNRNMFGWFLIGMVFSLLALLAVGMMGPPDKLDRTNSKTCPQCAETVRLEALKCRFCGHEFDSADITDQRNKQVQKEKDRAMAIILAVVGIAVVIGIAMSPGMR